MTRARALHSIVFAVAVSLLSGPTVRADVATSWNEKAGDIVVAARLPAPNSTRLLAIVQTAAYEAVKAVTGHDGRGGTGSKPAAGASVEAAVAAANRVTLSRLVPSQQAAIESAYAAALSAIPEGPARTEGISAGEKAAEAVLASRANDGAEKPDSYRPRTAAGVYVMTVLPVATQWPERKPWWMTRPDQFRPGPPPELTSATWARTGSCADPGSTRPHG